MTSHYAHPTSGPVELVRCVSAALAPGGTLLVVNHDHSDESAGTHTCVEELATGLPVQGWTVEVAQTRSRPVQRSRGSGGEHAHTHGSRGQGHVLRDAVLRARRTG